MIITIPWESQGKMVRWNETCANIIEHFGLPGDKYSTEVSADEMKFDFKDDHDALMCKILISECVC